ncbi:MAG: nuclear transport factor 2 family protein [Nonomuraea sp.]|nr:nuclear transport factor 2 family protein [Nonomuraea sp.]NUP68122.1 nuclear transport factor 2 family protein [Nonomuraea sp.]NUP79182.1 nuclear transport factor 2 family protein [Nonomuraea sp.]NUS05219.1 nuclear transport factor 2 family protein [Nonomuraea sp.]NUT43956.1 nuclear transport factor 2 family protein [Thermoactinospora sp.]
MDRFNRAFVEHDRALLADLIADDCEMETIQPAPTGNRVIGRQACLDWWGALADDRTTWFEPQEVVVAGDRATLRWHYHFGPGPSDWVSGVNIMRVRDGRIVEALGFSKTAESK